MRPCNSLHESPQSVHVPFRANSVLYGEPRALARADLRPWSPFRRLAVCYTIADTALIWQNHDVDRIDCVDGHWFSVNHQCYRVMTGWVVDGEDAFAVAAVESTYANA